MVILFYIFKFNIWLLSRWPLRVLYFFSDITYFFIYYVFKYRKKIVFQNLRNSFPEKSEKEIEKIAKKFYVHFSDVLFEIIKLVYYSPEQLGKRINYTNPELLDEYYKNKKHVIAVVAHYGNWEWMSGLSIHSKHNGMSIYKPLRNKYFDDYFHKLREKFNMTLVPMRQTIHSITDNIKKENYTVSVFIADQSPVSTEIQYWTEFLNQETPMYMGIEKIAKKYNIPVVFYSSIKVARGRYMSEVIEVAKDPSKTKEYEITEKHVRILEDIIKKKPEYWLWTHRRWKYNKEDVLAKKYVKK